MSKCYQCGQDIEIEMSEPIFGMAVPTGKWKHVYRRDDDHRAYPDWYTADMLPKNVPRGNLVIS